MLNKLIIKFLLNVEPGSLMFLKTYNTELDEYINIYGSKW